MLGSYYLQKVNVHIALQIVSPQQTIYQLQDHHKPNLLTFKERHSMENHKLFSVFNFFYKYLTIQNQLSSDSSYSPEVNSLV